MKDMACQEYSCVVRRCPCRIGMVPLGNVHLLDQTREVRALQSEQIGRSRLTSAGQGDRALAS